MSTSDSQLFEIPQLVAFGAALEETLQTARNAKPTATIEPRLTKNDFPQLLVQLPVIFSTEANGGNDVDKSRQYMVIESVVRRRFDDLIATASIESAEFVEVWNILDITIVLAESRQCDSSLVLMLVELLMDSQTLQGCRVVFDYLESRRERLIKDLTNMKGLIILRTCNELLRRLSRAEDISFSGRVFIFMFQSFPMGDKGTVNLRGSYHTENVTTWEEIAPNPEEPAPDQMDVDTKESAATKPPPPATGAKAVSFDARDKPASQKPLEPDALYPIFWSLQNYFGQPLKLFDAQNMTKFKSALEATLVAFESLAQGQRNTQSSDDTKDVTKKRKRFEVDSSDSGNFNPKYLTSRDLFELEMSDLFFRRHILIQAVIILDFLRSLSASARAKHANIRQPNKSVMYSDKSISEEDDKWAETMKSRIQDYIYAGPDGAYVHRILIAVTQREKGWTRWKMETCPPMQKPAVTPAEFNEARESAKRLATSKRLRPHPMGSLNLDFLSDENDESAMEKFKDPARWKLPELATFKDKIAADDLELEFAKSEKEKAQIIEAKASKTWRALRIASRTRMAALDKIDDWQDISAVFQEPKQPNEEEEEEEEGEVGRIPEDKQTIIISGPEGVGKSSLIVRLQDAQPRVFQKVIRHTTRQAKDGEVDGQDYHFVDAATFNRMSDNDQFVEVTNKDGFDVATSGKAIDSIKESGKIPFLEMDRASVQSCKDWGLSARIIFISPPSTEQLEAWLKQSGKYPEDAIAGVLKTAEEEVEQSKSDASFYDTLITNDEPQSAYKALEEFIYGSSIVETNGVHEVSATKDGDVTMAEEEPNGTAQSSTEELAETA
ncbi:putative Guanylate kinase-like domain-containing protein [Seiridium cardinale]|uniref:Guanylate kinase-like domain-containing protein n=1 Tax=Seiridium cardinale TaxID=138064 RepID=A0ABR2XMJ6_9PEZI